MTTPQTSARIIRCSTGQFFRWLAPFFIVLLWSGYAMFRVWARGLNQTHMNDAYGFGLWIWADLVIIALGGGSFFCGLLAYILGKREIKNILNYAVIIGFVCYSSALLILMVDVGQPLRLWFVFRYVNVHSMLTAVAFCLTAYFVILCIEFLPIILGNRKLDSVSYLHHLRLNLNRVMAFFAATGIFLSFFHQGALGGLTGVLYGRPFSYRQGIFIWPWTFFLFVWSAAAVGPCFILLITKATEKITRRKLVGDAVYWMLARISGWMLLTYTIAKIADTWYWADYTAPSLGYHLMDFYSGSQGYPFWPLIAEIGVCGLLPALILILKNGRENRFLLIIAALLAVLGVCINRWAMAVYVLSIPLFSFNQWYRYFPSWQEWAVALLPVAYGAIVLSLAHRYLPTFPQEKELNPTDEPGILINFIQDNP